MTDENQKRVEEIERTHLRMFESIPIGVDYHMKDCEKCFLLSAIKSLREEKEHLRSLIRTQETEPPADVPDDQTTEMAVRIAELEAEINKLVPLTINHVGETGKNESACDVAVRLIVAANERGERMRQAILAYQKAHNHVWQFGAPTDKEAIKVGAEIEAAEKMMYDALAETQEDEKAHEG